MSAMPAGPGRSTETLRDTATAEPARHGRLRAAAAARGVPLATILVTVAVVALTYLAGKLAYRIRDVLLMLMVAGPPPKSSSNRLTVESRQPLAAASAFCAVVRLVV